MNGPSLKIVTAAAALGGEFQRMLLAAGIVMLIIFISWGIQEWGIRKSASAIGWLGLLCLGLVGLGAAALIWLGLI